MLTLFMFDFFKKNPLTAFLSLLLLINLINLIFFPDPLFQLKKNLYSFSVGQSYFSRISLINYYAQSGDWNQAQKLAKDADPADTSLIFSNLHPDKLKNRLNQLVYKSNKNADDYVQIAKIYFQLGQSSQTLENLDLARQTDPIRQDLQTLYYQFQKQSN